MKRPDGNYRQFWPEQAEHTVDYEMRVPPWRVLDAQAAVFRAEMLARRDRGEPLPPVGLNLADRHSFGTIVAPYPPEQFTAANLLCFQYLPSIIQIKEEQAARLDQLIQPQVADTTVARLRDLQRSLGRKPTLEEMDAVFPNGVPVESPLFGEGLQVPHGTNPLDAFRSRVDELQDQVRSEMAHSLYHHAMWRKEGRHVYVLDPTTYTLLAHTPLPDLPASILSAPYHSFYLVLPPDAFTFGVWNARTQEIDRQPIEGVMVALDNVTPDSPNQRELAFMAIGQGESVSDRNLAFISLAIGPDAKVSEIAMPGAGRIVTESKSGLAVRRYDAMPLQGFEDKEGWKDGENGGNEIGVVLPRVILSLLLYLASEHPDIEPVAPAPRRSFADIRSPKQRQTALENQAKKLKGATRLPILYIGRHLHEEIDAERERVERDIAVDGGRTYKLDHPVWVRGHWRKQPYGAGRAQYRIIWIRPYQKGPDLAASMKVQAAKIQRAQPADHH